MSEMELEDIRIEPRLWLSCAGPTVKMPRVNSKVYYFPQGHAEHSDSHVDFAALPRLKSMILCTVVGMDFLVDRKTDEIFAKMRLVPSENNGYHCQLGENRVEYDGHIFADNTHIETYSQTLTQSDANNGGGFSVPKVCADTMFPPLDYTADTPVQMVYGTDFKGETWIFRHIFRGTPRRHLLTSGWSSFVNRKKLVAGDGIVFMRPDNGELRVGIRRGKKGSYSVPEPPAKVNTNQGSYGGLSAFLREEEGNLMQSGGSKSVNDSGGSSRDGGRVTPESVIEAASLARRGHPFEVLYYPRLYTQQFVVEASSVETANNVSWCPGMRFKMAFDTEDFSKINWFHGTITSCDVADQFYWPDSRWRSLQVVWDEPDSPHNIRYVNPWNIKLISHLPHINFPFSPPNKRLCLNEEPDMSSFESQLPLPSFTNTPFNQNNIVGSSRPFPFPPDDITADLQGAGHTQFRFPPTYLHPRNTVPLGVLATNYHQQVNDDATNGVDGEGNENISCLLTIGNSSQKEEDSEKPPAPLFLFGQHILTEQQMFQVSSSDQIPQTSNENNFNLEEKIL